MNQKQTELAAAALDERHRVISPHYADLLGRFSALAVNTAVLQDLQHETEAGQANYDLVDKFVGELPTTIADSKPTFLAPDAETARRIQSTVIWGFNIDYSKQTEKEAYFVVGSKPITPTKKNGADMSLLLARARQPDTFIKASRLFTALTWSAELEAIQEVHKKNLVSAYSDEEITEMYKNGSQSQLAVNEQQPASVVFNTPYTSGLDSTYPWGRSRLNAADKVKHEWKKYGRRLEGGPLINQVQQARGTISDAMLVEYDVIDHLGALAEVFNKEDDLRSLVKKAAVDYVDPFKKLSDEQDAILENAKQKPESDSRRKQIAARRMRNLARLESVHS